MSGGDSEPWYQNGLAQHLSSQGHKDVEACPAPDMGLLPDIRLEVFIGYEERRMAIPAG